MSIGIILLSGGCGLLDRIPSQKQTGYATGTRQDAGTVSSIDWGAVRNTPIELGKGREPELAVGKSGELKRPETISLPEHTFLTETQKNLLATAKGKLGCRYSSAGTGPNTFDCSGFMLYVFAKEGIDLPHGSAAQYSCGKSLKKDEPLKTGDLVFFSGRKISSNVGHVGMVVDYDRNTREFTFIHAAMTGVEIQKSTAEYYALRYIGARRILADD